MHCRISFDLATPPGRDAYRAFLAEAADLVVAHGGSLSGEHGDGQARSELLPRMFGPQLIGAFAELKAMFDPRGRMNPGRIVDPVPVTRHLKDAVAARRMRCVGAGAAADPRAGRCARATWSRATSSTPRAAAPGSCTSCSRARRSRRRPQRRRAGGAGLCLSCKACKAECPVGVDMAAYKAEFSTPTTAAGGPRAAYTMGLIGVHAPLAARAPGWPTRSPARAPPSAWPASRPAAGSPPSPGARSGPGGRSGHRSRPAARRSPVRRHLQRPLPPGGAAGRRRGARGVRPPRPCAGRTAVLRPAPVRLRDAPRRPPGPAPPRRPARRRLGARRRGRAELPVGVQGRARRAAGRRAARRRAERPRDDLGPVLSTPGTRRRPGAARRSCTATATSRRRSASTRTPSCSPHGPGGRGAGRRLLRDGGRLRLRGRARRRVRADRRAPPAAAPPRRRPRGPARHGRLLVPDPGRAAGRPPRRPSRGVWR